MSKVRDDGGHFVRHDDRSARYDCKNRAPDACANLLKGQLLNETHSQTNAHVGLIASLVTTHQTATTGKDQSSASTAAFDQPMVTSASLPGCAKDCTLDLNYLSSNHHTWSKCQDTLIVGRIHYVVDSGNNKTSTSTSYSEYVTFFEPYPRAWVTSAVSDLLVNGSHILTRTDVNEAGTVTHVDGTETV